MQLGEESQEIMWQAVPSNTIQLHEALSTTVRFHSRTVSRSTAAEFDPVYGRIGLESGISAQRPPRGFYGSLRQG
jgi:hypothetical protein